MVIGEDPPFGSEARDAFGLRTNGAGGVASSRFTKKSSEIDLCDKTRRRARGWRARENAGGPALPSMREKNKNLARM